MPPSSLEFQNLSYTTSRTFKLFQGTLLHLHIFQPLTALETPPRCAYISRVSGHGRLHCTREARVDTAASNGLALFLLSAARNTTVSLSIPAHTPAAR